MLSVCTSVTGSKVKDQRSIYDGSEVGGSQWMGGVKWVGGTEWMGGCEWVGAYGHSCFSFGLGSFSTDRGASTGVL
jgi:hypothetical protein